jgi:type VI secretion system protein ImpF
MSRIDPHQGLMPSLLDRLIDPEADGTSWQHGYSVQQMVAAVFRDLEELLNTRQTAVGIPPEFAEVRDSIVAYGMPDLTTIAAVTPEQRAAIGRVLEDMIQRFEPRLRDIRAILLDPGQAIKRTVKFRIEARMRVEPAPEVAFDTILELTTGHSTLARTDET